VISGSSHGLRGGSWLYDASDLRASDRNRDGGTTFEDFTVGFRGASVPEPTCLVLTMPASVAMFARRKR
jgi:formylglycine-generating enzyme required for sulfatase activity